MTGGGQPMAEVAPAELGKDDSGQQPLRPDRADAGVEDQTG